MTQYLLYYCTLLWLYRTKPCWPATRRMFRNKLKCIYMKFFLSSSKEYSFYQNIRRAMSGTFAAMFLHFFCSVSNHSAEHFFAQRAHPQPTPSNKILILWICDYQSNYIFFSFIYWIRVQRKERRKFSVGRRNAILNDMTRYAHH